MNNTQRIRKVTNKHLNSYPIRQGGEESSAYQSRYEDRGKTLDREKFPIWSYGYIFIKLPKWGISPDSISKQLLI